MTDQTDEESTARDAAQSAAVADTDARRAEEETAHAGEQTEKLSRKERKAQEKA